MNSSKIVIRIHAANPDHHLWNNNGVPLHRTSHAAHQATHSRVAWNKEPYGGTITSRSTAVCILGILFP
jgi:hypothetical protein